MCLMFITDSITFVITISTFTCSTTYYSFQDLQYGLLATADYLIWIWKYFSIMLVK